MSPVRTLNQNVGEGRSWKGLVVKTSWGPTGNMFSETEFQLSIIYVLLLSLLVPQRTDFRRAPLACKCTVLHATPPFFCLPSSSLSLFYLA